MTNLVPTGNHPAHIGQYSPNQDTPAFIVSVWPATLIDAQLIIGGDDPTGFICQLALDPHSVRLTPIMMPPPRTESGPCFNRTTLDLPTRYEMRAELNGFVEAYGETVAEAVNQAMSIAEESRA